MESCWRDKERISTALCLPWNGVIIAFIFFWNSNNSVSAIRRLELLIFPFLIPLLFLFSQWTADAIQELYLPDDCIEFSLNSPPLLDSFAI